MNDHIKNLARSISVLAVLGWLSSTLANVPLHRWWSLVPLLNTVISVFLAIRIHQAIKRA